MVEKGKRVQLTGPCSCLLDVCFSRVFFSKGFLVEVAGGRFSGQKLKLCRSWRTRPYSSWNCAMRLPSVPTLLENWRCRYRKGSALIAECGSEYSCIGNGLENNLIGVLGRNVMIKMADCHPAPLKPHKHKIHSTCRRGFSSPSVVFMKSF